MVGSALDDGSEELVSLTLLESDPSIGKVTMLALPPGGMVTTQNLTLSAPDPTWLLVTPPTPFLDGSISQGKPRQLPVKHSILMPKSGLVSLCHEPV